MRDVALILNINKPYDRKVVAGIARFTRLHSNWRVYLEDEPLDKIPNLKEWEGHGIIADLDDQHVLDALEHLTIPVVNIGGALFDVSWTNKSPWITSDNAAVARMAAEHFLNQGYTNFAYCGFRKTPFNPWSRMRGETFGSIIKAQGHFFSEYQSRHQTARRWEAVQARLCKWLETLPLPIGLFTCNDARARHVLEACRRLGLRVPRDVAILGVDNDELMCDIATPTLSSISLGTDRVGFEAASLLDDLISGVDVPEERLQRTIEPSGIITRESTSRLATSDTIVAAAVDFIRSNIDAGVQVMDVAKHVKLSRSTLDNRFKSELNRTVHDEIEIVRLERIKELLLTTNFTLSEISDQTGFTTVQYMATVFRRMTGQTPGSFRKKHAHN